MSGVFKAIGGLFSTGSSAADRAAKEAQATASAQYAQTEAERAKATAKQQQLMAEANALQAQQFARTEQANQLQANMQEQQRITDANKQGQQDPLENVVNVVPGGSAAASDTSGDVRKRRKPGLATQLGLSG